MKRAELPENVLQRRAVVYVRQSSAIQVQENLESQRRQYELADLATEYGFREVVTIDEDLGRSRAGSSHGLASKRWSRSSARESSGRCSASRRRGSLATGATGIICSTSADSLVHV